jgi:hypothetical protein
MWSTVGSFCARDSDGSLPDLRVVFDVLSSERNVVGAASPNVTLHGDFPHLSSQRRMHSQYSPSLDPGGFPGG